MSSKLERIFYIDQQIRAGRFPSAKAIAERFEVSERTIYDDHTFMRDRLHAPIEWDDERRGWFYGDDTYVLPTIWINEGELLALFLGQILSQQYLGTTFEEQLRDGINKITKHLPEEVKVNLTEAAECYIVQTGFTAIPTENVREQLEWAIRRKRQINIRYYTASRGTTSERTVDPYQLFTVIPNWYLLAHDHHRDDIRSFRLDRIEQLDVLPSTFEIDPEFSAEAHLAQGFLASTGDIHPVAIRFDAEQARYIREKQWHPSQEPLEELEDGGVILRFRAGGLDAIQRWVLQYGSHAQVIEPAVLRDNIAAESSRLNQLYSQSAD